MKKSINLAPPNSLILVLDHAFGSLPDSMDGQLIASTDSCVAIGTLSEDDGSTQITITENYEALADDKMVFDGVLKTPNKKLSVCDVNNSNLIEVQVNSSIAHIQIFVNDPVEPNRIVVNVK